MMVHPINKIRGFTLMEMLVIVIIVGILSALALPLYTGSKERALGREANATVKLIAGAEKNYRLETDNFYNDTNITNINANLKLAIVENNWDYNISGSGTIFTVTASRKSPPAGYSCTYTLSYDASSPTNDEVPSRNSTTGCP